MARSSGPGAMPRLCALWCLLVIAGCGGGGGGDGPVVDPDVLPLYLFALGNTNAGPHFEVSFSEGGSDYSVVVSFPGGGMGGVWDLEHGLYTIADGSRVDVDSDAGDALLGMFQIEVTSDIPTTWTAPPTEGGFEVTQGVVTTDVSFHGATVDVSVGGGPPSVYPFEDFEDLMGSAASDDHQRAGFAWGILDYMLARARLVTSTFELIDDADLQTVNPATGDCSSYGILTPPPAVANPGSWSFLWADVSGNGQVGPGDTFTWSFSECWEDLADDDSDLLWGGSIQHANLTKVVSGGFLTRMGYEPNGGDGGVFFSDTPQTETRIDSGAVLLGQQRLLNGSFKAVWWAP